MLIEQQLKANGTKKGKQEDSDSYYDSEEYDDEDNTKQVDSDHEEDIFDKMAKGMKSGMRDIKSKFGSKDNKKL